MAAAGALLVEAESGRGVHLVADPGAVERPPKVDAGDQEAQVAGEGHQPSPDLRRQLVRSQPHALPRQARVAVVGSVGLDSVAPGCDPGAPSPR